MTPQAQTNMYMGRYVSNLEAARHELLQHTLNVQVQHATPIIMMMALPLGQPADRIVLFGLGNLRFTA